MSKRQKTGTKTSNRQCCIHLNTIKSNRIAAPQRDTDTDTDTALTSAKITANRHDPSKTESSRRGKIGKKRAIFDFAIV